MAGAVALAAALFGCAAPGGAGFPPELERVPPAFELQARISVSNGERSDIARLRWTHRPASDEWVVSSPLGNEVGRIDSGAWGARLQRADGPPEEAASFGVLSERLFGAALEPAALNAWLHGAAPATDPGGWRVSIDESQGAGSVVLARRITATREALVVKLVIDQYRVLGE